MGGAFEEDQFIQRAHFGQETMKGGRSPQGFGIGHRVTGGQDIHGRQIGLWIAWTAFKDRFRHPVSPGSRSRRKTLEILGERVCPSTIRI